MDQFVINLIFVGGSFALYIGIAIWARAGSTADFYAASRGVNPVVNGAATAADWMSAASFISMAGLIAAVGYGNSTFLMGWTGGYVILALLLAPYLRKFGRFTVPDFIGDRFYSQTARLVAVISLLVMSITYVIGQMTGAAVAFSRFLEVDSTTGLFIASAVVFCYAVLGGMKGITYTQLAQYCVLIVAYTIPAVFISLQLTGNPLPQLGLFSTHTESGQPLLQTLNEVLIELGFNDYTGNHGSTFNMVLFTLSLMIGTAGLPHVIIRFFTVPKVADARTSAGWALVFIALLYTVAPAVGAMARLNIITTLYPEGIQGEPLAFDNKPDWMLNWERTGLLRFEDKNGDGLIQYYNEANPPQRAIDEGWEGNEMVLFNNDILVLANPEIANLPSWVIGLIAAGGLAAALSTAAGLLLAISSAVSHDLIKSIINPGISEKGELLAARISMAFAIALATYLGLNPPGFAAQVVALAFGLAAASLFPAIMMGIFSKKMNSTGAITGMIVGLGSTVLYIFTYLGWFFIPGTNMLPNTPDNWLFGISPLSFGAVGAALNFIAAFIVMKISAPVPVEIEELVESIRVPKGAGDAVAH
ncbi:sodium:solute symporter family protein [Roseinatronobacter bogoriensis]|uniref:Cation acetate symporter n=1 Tax=Roseinatronobacter bogoriensis subsp. barguzinensis TaxID=441209 RepID=A0A2K8KJY4_9RHOB|nr:MULTISPECIES: sodium:solute symporter family protein [Rhodobaca]ATX67318.1 cation acetate symporter [Rhodobaca barguzinensis]MBB4206880.1 cation/acetate symporter [Rhodobaca bogoriensis DSM 18756]TDW41623.1 cation/acetate symporter [Rhodobaca barguzinensis]TDY74198.1 cation/acetate symporter [Rhodobaca bogoriensis DSM 18756]